MALSRIALSCCQLTPHPLTTPPLAHNLQIVPDNYLYARISLAIKDKSSLNEDDDGTKVCKHGTACTGGNRVGMAWTHSLSRETGNAFGSQQVEWQPAAERC